MKHRFPEVRVVGKDSTGKPIAEIHLLKSHPKNWTSLPSVSQSAWAAIVISEDWAFFQHKGYDPTQISKAIQEDLQKGKFARGASTITQQVVKNVFLEKDKNLWRKFKEIHLAVEMERTLGKRKILEIYLNIAEWGHGIYGIRRAADFYFGKSPEQLTAKEGAFLAMLLPSPKKYNQSFRIKELTPFAKTQIQSILEKMVQAHRLSAEEFHRELSEPLIFRNQS